MPHLQRFTAERLTSEQIAVTTIGSNEDNEPTTKMTPSIENLDKEQTTEDSSQLVPSFHEGSSRHVYICDVCSKMYSTKYALRRHLNVHEEGKHKCSICHVYYNTAEDLEIHRQKSHAGPLLCSTCGKAFTRKSALKLHILRNHDVTYKAKFRCEVGTCSRSFHTEKSFMEHINKHAQIKPYTCEKCQKSFTLKSTLRTHERACVQNVKFHCSECDKNFESSGALSNHKQSVHEHKLYPCSCGKIFKYLPGLISHKRKKGH